MLLDVFIDLGDEADLLEVLRGHLQELGQTGDVFVYREADTHSLLAFLSNFKF